MRRIIVLAAVLAASLTFPPGAGAASRPAGGEGDGTYVATIRTTAGSYRAVIRDPAMLAKARAELAGEGDAGVPIGRLAWGHGGVNYGHRWHVEELGFADFTIELCDGSARMVDRDPAYWVEVVGSFCPWAGAVVSLEPFIPRHPGRPVR